MIGVGWDRLKRFAPKRKKLGFYPETNMSPNDA